MHARPTHRRPIAIAVASVLALGALTGTAAAVLTGSAGGAQFRMDNRAENAPTSSNATVWNAVPGTPIPVAVPAGASRLINARFTVETGCGGPNSGRCLLRIVAQNAAGGIVELDPASPDFTVDTDEPGAGNDFVEGHAMERSRRLGAGNWRVFVQRRVSNNTTTLTLDDFHFAVETSA